MKSHDDYDLDSSVPFDEQHINVYTRNLAFYRANNLELACNRESSSEKYVWISMVVEKSGNKSIILVCDNEYEAVSCLQDCLGFYDKYRADLIVERHEVAA